MERKIFLMLTLLLFLSSFTMKKRVITIFMIGDSTMSNKPIIGANPERGWGHVLSSFFTEDVCVENHAQNGRSSKSFISEGRWATVLKRLQPGDYVIIQFGHNDEKTDEARHTVPGTTFDDNLCRFVTEARACGAIPVLLNSIVRRNFISSMDSSFIKDNRPTFSTVQDSMVEGDILFDTHGDYLKSPRNVAFKMNVPFIDANRITHQLIEKMGPQKSKEVYLWVKANSVPIMPEGRQDNTHLSVYGARLIAGLIVDEIGKKIPELARYIRHYDFVVAKDGSGDFFSVQEAIDAIPDFRKTNTSILIRPGIYKEKLVISNSKSNLCLFGQSGTVISNADFVGKENYFGEQIDTLGTATCYIFASNLSFENIIFENVAKQNVPAIACFISGDCIRFENCRFLSNQNTVYCSGSGAQLFVQCYIEGISAIIQRGKNSVFENCIIRDKVNI